MRHTLTRRALVVAACLASIAVAAEAQAKPVSFSVPLAGAQQVPPVQTTGSGKADLTWDSDTRKVTWTISYSGLTGPATMAHFHGPATLGKNAAPVIWLTTRGSPAENPIKGEATLTPEQAQQFVAGEWYVNVHTEAHKDGEIRAQVVPPKG